MGIRFRAGTPIELAGISQVENNKLVVGDLIFNIIINKPLHKN